MAEPIRKLDILCTDPDTTARMRVRTATSAHVTFGKFLQSNSLEDALRRLSGSENIDLIFINEKLHEGLAEFVKQAKETHLGQDAAYVVILHGSDEMQATMAKYMIAGVDSFLQEPFSADAINEIAQLAIRIKRERAEARENAAIRFLIEQISERVTSIAQIMAAGMDAKREQKKLQDMCVVFNTLDEEKRKKYLDVAGDVFEKARIPPPLPKPTYRGASSRVKKRMEEKILSQIAGSAE